MRIVNLTQHNATPDQKASGAVDLPETTRALVREALTFNDLPDADVIRARAQAIVGLMLDCIDRLDWDADAAMIGGAPYLMSALESELREVGIRPLYAFSIRESVEAVAEDGSVTKQTVFKHEGFVEA